jgi:hypothetical protein
VLEVGAAGACDTVVVDKTLARSEIASVLTVLLVILAPVIG